MVNQYVPVAMPLAQFRLVNGEAEVPAPQAANTGRVTSCTVTVAVWLTLLPLLSASVTVTVLAPTLAQVKVFGVTLTVAVPQLSLTVPVSTWALLTVALPLPSSCTVAFWVNGVGTRM